MVEEGVPHNDCFAARARRARFGLHGVGDLSMVHDWLGLVMAIVSVVLLPISIPVVTIAMLFIHSAVAGPWVLWPGIVLFGVLDGVARKRGESLLLK